MSSHVFGPVPSRRLGRSLGLDLVPMKTCSFDCIYCQLGRTTRKTTQRKTWVPIDDLLSELADKLATRPDYVTLSGSGEPTLCAEIGQLVDRVKTMTDVPVAVLTNGSLLWQEEVRRQLREADLVIPSLDAGSPQAFQRVNRPHEEVTFERLMEGLVALGREFRGQVWLEVFLLADLTDDDAEVSRLTAWVERIRPDRVQLNTVARPPAEGFALAVPQPRMDELARRFDPPGEVICEFHTDDEPPEIAANRDRILDLLRRRPCTLDDVAAGLGMHPAEVAKYLEQLTADQGLVETRSAGRLYYRLG